VHHLISSQPKISICGTNQYYGYKTKQGKICANVPGFTLNECCFSQVQSYEMLCSPETYVLEVVEGSCEGKLTSLEGAAVM